MKKLIIIGYSKFKCHPPSKEFYALYPRASREDFLVPIYKLIN